MQESVLMLSTLLTIVQSCDDRRLVKLVHDAYRFILNHRSIIEQAPLQTYYSALMFSPSKSVLRKVFRSQVSRWITCVSRTTKNWGSLMQTLEGEDPVVAVRFSPDGEKLMCVSMNFTVRIWDARTGTLLHRLQDEDLSKYEIPSRYPVFNRQKIAFVWPDTIEVWDVTFESRIQIIERNDIVLAALSPTEQKLASGSSSGSVRVWDITSGLLLQTYEDYAGDIMSLEFSPNGQKLASKFAPKFGNRSKILLWDLGSVSLLHTPESQFWQYNRESIPLAFSHNGKIIACGFDDDTVEIWDAESGAALQRLRGLDYTVAGIAFLLNEQHLASWDNIGTVQVWNITSGSPLHTSHCDLKKSESVLAFSPIGRRLASGGWDGNVIVWDAAFNSPLSQKFQGHDDGIQCLVFSPNGQKLASLCHRSIICLWDVATGSLLKRFIKASYTSSVSFSVDGSVILCHRADYIASIWDAESGLRLYEYIVNEDHHLTYRNATTANPSYGLSLYGLNLIDRWVIVNQKRLIWAPPPARQGSAFATYGSKIAIGSFSGDVFVLDLDLELMESSIAWPPNLEHGRVVSPSDVYAFDSASEDDDESSDIEDPEMEDSEMEEPEVEDSEMGECRRERGWK